MANTPNKLSLFWQELKRRNVVRVITVYAGAAFVILELVDMITEPFGLPAWTFKLVIVLLSIGFIVAIILSWIYDIHPEGGVVKTKPTDKIIAKDIPKSSNSWKIASYISFVVIIGLITLNIFGINRGTRMDESLVKSIAVLPFHNLSGEDEKEYICDGLTNEIISHLFKVRSFEKVVSFYSVMNYKDPQRNIPKIAEELGVNYILEGSYKRMGDKLKITAQLIDPQSDNHLWLKDFEEPYTEVMGIPGDIALQIAEYLVTYVSRSEKQKIQKAHTYNQEAWEKHLLGLHYKVRSGRDREYLDNALRLFEEAITLDPDFALAYTEMAEVSLMLYWFKFDLSPDILARSREAIDVALRIEPDLAEAHIQLARYYYSVFLDYPRSLELLSKAAKIAPGHPEIHFWTGVNYRRMGKWEESAKQIETAIEIDPRHLDNLQNLTDNYMSLKMYDKMENCIRLGDEIESTNFVQYELRMLLSILREGNTAAARKVIEGIETQDIREKLENASLYISPIEIDFFEDNYQKVLDFTTSATDWKGLVNTAKFQPKTLFQARAYDLLEMHEKAIIYYDSARMEIEEMQEQFQRDPRLKGPLGVCYAGLGDKERAIELGKKAVEEYSMEKDAYFGLMRIEELAWIYVLVEEYEMALELVDVLLSSPGYYSVPLLKLDPKWAPLWNNPEFIKLTEKY